MKTAQEILAKINATQEAKRDQLGKWAIGVIDQATEKMFSQETTSISTGIMCYDERFKEALRLEEVQKVLEGFKIEARAGSSYFFICIAK